MRSATEGRHKADMRRSEPGRKPAEKRELQARDAARAICDSPLDTTGKQQSDSRKDTPGAVQKAKGATGRTDGRGGRGGGSKHEHAFHVLLIPPMLRGRRHGHHKVVDTGRGSVLDALYWLRRTVSTMVSPSQ